MASSSGNPKRLAALLVALGVASAAFLLIRWRAASTPTSPSAAAGPVEQMRFYTKRIKEHPEDRSAYLALGKLEEQQEYYISALRRLYAARALGVPDRDVVMPIGRSLSHLARWDEARAELTKAVELMPDSVEAAANLAGVFFNSGDAQNASKTLDAFVGRHRSTDGSVNLSADDLRRLMLCYSEARDHVKAGEIARQIIRVAPNDVGAYSIAGHTLVLQQRYRDALPLLEKAASLESSVAALCYDYGTALELSGRDDEALRQFQRCVLLNPNATDAFLALDKLYEKRKNWKLASVAMSNAALHSKTNVSVLFHAGKTNERAGNRNDSLYWYSNSAIAARKYPEALGYATTLSKSTDPSWRDAGILNMADAYHGMHRMKEYLAAVKSVAKSDTADGEMRLAGAYEKADLLEKQIECLNRALTMEPKLAPIIQNSLAQNYSRRGRLDEAEKALEKAISDDPKNADYRTQLGSIYLQRRYLGDRARKAMDQYEQVVRIEPKEASGYQNLGIACAAANDLADAAFNLEHAIDLQPGYGPSYEELGRVYAKMGDRAGSDLMLSLYRKYVRYDQTLKTLTARADQNKTDAMAQVELADLYVRSGDLASAVDRYSLALQLKPSDADIKRKYDRVIRSLTQSNTTENPER